MTADNIEQMDDDEQEEVVVDEAQSMAADLMLLLSWREGGGLTEMVQGVESYENAGVLTRDAGFVLKLADGRRFNITVQKGRSY